MMRDIILSVSLLLSCFYAPISWLFTCSVLIDSSVPDLTIWLQQIQGMHLQLVMLPQEMWSIATLSSDLISKTGRYCFSIFQGNNVIV